MLTRKQLQRAAADSGFPVDSVEKVWAGRADPRRPVKLQRRISNELTAAARALDARRPAEAAARLTHALAETDAPLEEETLLALHSAIG